MGKPSIWAECSLCNGTGQIDLGNKAEGCNFCHGTGYMGETEKLAIRETKPTWEQATKKNLVVWTKENDQHYWVKICNMEPERGPELVGLCKYIGGEDSWRTFEDIKGCRFSLTEEYTQIQPAQSPPALEG